MNNYNSEHMGSSNGTNNDTESSVKMNNTIPTYVVVRTKNYKNVVTAQDMLRHGKADSTNRNSRTKITIKQ